MSRVLHVKTITGQGLPRSVTLLYGDAVITGDIDWVEGMIERGLVCFYDEVVLDSNTKAE